MSPFTFIFIVALINFAPSLKPVQEATRVEFAGKMAKVKKGDSKLRVENVLGEADMILTNIRENLSLLREGVQYSGATEIWYYGTNKANDFPTLGQVHFDQNGNVIEIYGDAGNAMHSERINEADLKELLRLLDSMPVAKGRNWNPLIVIEIVNSLVGLGKDDGIAVFREYLRISPPSFEIHEQVCLLLRLLHEVPEEMGCFPEMKLGLPSSGFPKDMRLMPRFPVHVIDEIPVLMVSGYIFSGDVPDDNLEILDWFDSNAIWRKTELNTQQLTDEQFENIKRKVEGLGGQYLDSFHTKMLVQMIHSQLEFLRKGVQDK
ncbi:MAG: hypothetical protein KF851_05480 [Pirellulaceae bacterium]|nr:hypothetical protein [Pirellulaceae bacterium]